MSAPSALAADITPPLLLSKPETSGKSDWAFAFSPYFWAAGLSGDIGQFGLPPVHTTTSFGDILKDLDFSFMATGEARNDRWSVFGDVMYTKTSSGSATPRGVVAGSVDLTSQTFAGLVGAGYSVFLDDHANFDLVGGMRVWHARTDISFSGGLLDGVSGNDSATWVDAMAGFRARYDLTEKVYVSGWGMLGGGQAKLDWDVAGIIGYKFNDKISGAAGYRALGVDYTKDRFVFDVVQQGPVLGLIVRF